MEIRESRRDIADLDPRIIKAEAHSLSAEQEIKNINADFESFRLDCQEILTGDYSSEIKMETHKQLEAAIATRDEAIVSIGKLAAGDILDELNKIDWLDPEDDEDNPERDY